MTKRPLHLLLCLYLLLGIAVMPVPAQAPAVNLAGPIGAIGFGLTGMKNVVLTDTNHTLTSSEAWPETLYLTAGATITTSHNLVAPLNPGQRYIVINNTSQTWNIGGSSGSTVPVPSGQTLLVVSNGVGYSTPPTSGGGGGSPGGSVGQVQLYGTSGFAGASGVTIDTASGTKLNTQIFNGMPMAYMYSANNTQTGIQNAFTAMAGVPSTVIADPNYTRFEPMDYVNVPLNSAIFDFRPELLGMTAKGIGTSYRAGYSMIFIDPGPHGGSTTQDGLAVNLNTYGSGFYQGTGAGNNTVDVAQIITGDYYRRGIGQALTMNLNTAGAGDKAIMYNTMSFTGYPKAGDDEGQELDVDVMYQPNTYPIYTATGSSVGSLTPALTCTSSVCTASDGNYLVDTTTADAGPAMNSTNATNNSVPVTGQTIGGIAVDANLAAYVNTGACQVASVYNPDSTHLIYNIPYSAVAQVADVHTINCTNLRGTMTTGLAEFTGPNQVEQVNITSASLSAGVWTITAAFRNYNVVGGTLIQGPLVGSIADFDAFTNTQYMPAPIRSTILVAGAEVNPSGGYMVLMYSNHKGDVSNYIPGYGGDPVSGPQSSFTLTSLSHAGGIATATRNIDGEFVPMPGTVTCSTDSSYNQFVAAPYPSTKAGYISWSDTGTSAPCAGTITYIYVARNHFTIRPRAEITQTAANGALTAIEPNRINFVSGNTMENPTPSVGLYFGMQKRCYVNSPSFNSTCFGETFGGTGAAGDFVGYNMTNYNTRGLYSKGGGPGVVSGVLTAPTAVSIHGPFSTYFNLDDTPIFGSVINIGCGTNGVADCNFPYYFLSAPGIGNVVIDPPKARIEFYQIMASTASAIVYQLEGDSTSNGCMGVSSGAMSTATVVACGAAPNWASPGVIGATAPNTGKFSALSASSLAGGTTNQPVCVFSDGTFYVSGCTGSSFDPSNYGTLGGGTPGTIYANAITTTSLAVTGSMNLMYNLVLNSGDIYMQGRSLVNWGGGSLGSGAALGTTGGLSYFGADRIKAPSFSTESGNTDAAGNLTLSAGTVSYTFAAAAGTHYNLPSCLVTDNSGTPAATSCAIVGSAGNYTGITITGTGTDSVSYMMMFHEN